MSQLNAHSSNAATDAIEREPERFEPVAALAAVAVPGLGHVVLGLFFGGIFIGGIDVVDRREDGVWFIGQALVGPIAFGADRLHQSLKVTDTVRGPNNTTMSVRRSAYPSENPRATKSLGRMNELGTLFTTIAGMLNFMAIVDAALHGRTRVVRRGARA